MRKFGWLLALMMGVPLICVAQIEEEPTASENPDEYRDCVVYTIEQADAATAPTGNQVIFTFSGLMTRAEVNNVDCGIISYIDAPSSEGGSGEGNGGGSIIGGGGSSSGNGGGNSGGSSSGNGGGSGSSSGNGGSSSGDNSGDGTPSGSLLPGRPPSQPSEPEPEPEPESTPTPTPTPEPEDEECPPDSCYWIHWQGRYNNKECKEGEDRHNGQCWNDDCAAYCCKAGCYINEELD